MKNSDESQQHQLKLPSTITLNPDMLRYVYYKREEWCCCNIYLTHILSVYVVVQFWPKYPCCMKLMRLTYSFMLFMCMLYHDINYFRKWKMYQNIVFRIIFNKFMMYLIKRDMIELIQCKEICSNVKIDFQVVRICMIQKIYHCLKRKKTMIPLCISYLWIGVVHIQTLIIVT